MKKPPFELTTAIFNACLNITEQLGRLQGMHYAAPPLELRRTNQLQGIQSSLAIEGNTLTLDEVTAIDQEEAILAAPREILEVNNALAVYKKIAKWRVYSLSSFKAAHGLMMQGLVKNSGQWRTKDVGVYAGRAMTHMAPPKTKVPQLMRDLFSFLRANDEISLLIKACVFHYEVEFIHPFVDGNGRMGRLWQQVILREFNPIFEFIPVETQIKLHQEEYYRVLKLSDHLGYSTPFIEFSLHQVSTALQSFYASLIYQPQSVQSRLMMALQKFDQIWFSRKDYLSLFKSISTATASRDLAQGVVESLLQRKGEKVNAVYRFLMKKRIES